MDTNGKTKTSSILRGNARSLKINERRAAAKSLAAAAEAVGMSLAFAYFWESRPTISAATVKAQRTFRRIKWAHLLNIAKVPAIEQAWVANILREVNAGVAR